MSKITIGEVVGGRYRIERLIGVGGMANVYKAVDVLTGKPVAIKELKEEYSQDAEFLRRFRLEAQAVLNLSHENIVRSKDIGLLDGDHYIVLEYVDGKTLKKLITEKAPFDDIDIIKIGAQLCEGLAHAHEANIIHRDVKPQNIMITDTGKVKITDFGIARFTDASTQTYQGANVLGSVYYISPEQARGESVGEKGDIYSLGVVLYEMATGRVPFDSENTVSIAIKHIQENAVPPRQLNPNMSVAMESIIMRAMDKDPDKRYGSMREMRRDLIRSMRRPDEAIAFDTPTRTVSRRVEQRHVAADWKRLGTLMIVLIATVGILAALFFMAKTLSDNASRGDAAYVPTLTGKSEADAEETAQRLGFKFVVRSRVTNDTVREGLVFEQEPKSGNRAKRGDSVYVDVSAGSPTIEMPMLEGETQESAEQLITDSGLVVGEVSMEYSDMPEGTVLRQIPEKGTFVETGEIVDIWISGDGQERIAVPSMTSKACADAVTLAHASGFDNVLVFIGEQQEGVASGTVVNQQPAGGEYVKKGEEIQLWCAPEASPEYSAKTTLKIELMQDDTEVRVLRLGQDANYVLYQQTLPAGAQSIQLEIISDEPGDNTIVTYADGEELRRDTVKVAKP